MVWVRSLVPNEKKSAASRDGAGGQGGAGQLDHRADEVVEDQRVLLARPVSGVVDLGTDVAQLLDGPDERHHDSGWGVAAPLVDDGCGLEDRLRLHLEQAGDGDAEAHTAQAEHRVLLVPKSAMTMAGRSFSWPRNTRSPASASCSSSVAGDARPRPPWRPTACRRKRSSAGRLRRASPRARWASRPGRQPGRRTHPDHQGESGKEKTLCTFGQSAHAARDINTTVSTVEPCRPNT